MKNLKDNIWIEGFCNIEKYDEMIVSLSAILYHGKTSDVPEEIAKECVDWHEFDSDHKLYYNYDGTNWKYTAKESIKSACNQEYCIIFKK